MMTDLNPLVASFDRFARVEGSRFRRVVSARYGVEVGGDAADSALAWGWENWERVSAMDNPAGYLYRVAQTHARRDLGRGRSISFPAEASSYEDTSEVLDGGLEVALRQLSEPQRVAVLMVHAYGWTPADVAALTGASASTVRSHLRRGLRRLRSLLPESNES